MQPHPDAKTREFVPVGRGDVAILSAARGTERGVSETALWLRRQRGKREMMERTQRQNDKAENGRNGQNNQCSPCQCPVSCFKHQSTNPRLTSAPPPGITTLRSRCTSTTSHTACASSAAGGTASSSGSRLPLAWLDFSYGETQNEETRNSEFESSNVLNVEGGFP